VSDVPRCATAAAREQGRRIRQRQPSRGGCGRQGAPLGAWRYLERLWRQSPWPLTARTRTGRGVENHPTPHPPSPPPLTLPHTGFLTPSRVPPTIPISSRVGWTQAVQMTLCHGNASLCWSGLCWLVSAWGRGLALVFDLRLVVASCGLCVVLCVLSLC
jgi:hypothetical protein